MQRNAWPRPRGKARFTGNSRCTSGGSTFLSVPIVKECASTPSHGPSRFTSQREVSLSSIGSEAGNTPMPAATKLAETVSFFGCIPS